MSKDMLFSIHFIKHVRVNVRLFDMVSELLNRKLNTYHVAGVSRLHVQNVTKYHNKNVLKFITIFGISMENPFK